MCKDKGKRNAKEELENCVLGDLGTRTDWLSGV